MSDTLTAYAKAAKAHMKTTTDAKCLLDFWSIEINEEIEAAAKAGTPAHKHTTDFEMGNTMLDFLFASQDASTASLTWIFALLDEHPEVLAKVCTAVSPCDADLWQVREEQVRVRPNDEALTEDVFEQLVYTRAVIKEILRLRPPASFVPQMAMADVQLTPEYTVPKGLSSACISVMSIDDPAQARSLSLASGRHVDRDSRSPRSLIPSA